MRIKELSQAARVPVDSIRHYEKAGLLHAPTRSGNGYRRYAEADLQRLRFIRNCRALDMSLDEVRTLLGFVDRPPADCAPVDGVIAEHLAHVRERLDGLRTLERQLELLVQACGHAEPQALCGIVLALSRDTPDDTPRGPGRGVHTA
jgi:DNA-binding transcriptional MerR regulator